MNLIDLFMPRQVKCIFCNRETPKFGICGDCYEHLPMITSPSCEICGGRLTGKGKVCIECKNRQMNFEKCYCVLEYSGDIKTKIISFKQNGVKHIGETFAFLMEDKFSSINESVDIIIPVPINEARLIKRGFNQSEVLCENLKSTGKVNTTVLSRIKDTPHQTGLGRHNREDNLKGAFEVKDKKSLKDKTILIVDDIYTTGSTLNEVARTLLKCKPKKVIAMCLARSPIKVDRIVK